MSEQGKQERWLKSLQQMVKGLQQFNEFLAIQDQANQKFLEQEQTNSSKP